MSDTLRTIFALPSLQEFIVICGMLLATYSTRLIGWLVLRRHPVRRACSAFWMPRPAA